jgi:hypothetical protein
MCDDIAVQLWICFWAGMSAGVVLGAFIFSMLSINGDNKK